MSNMGELCFKAKDPKLHFWIQILEEIDFRKYMIMISFNINLLFFLETESTFIKMQVSKMSSYF